MGERNMPDDAANGAAASGFAPGSGAALGAIAGIVLGLAPEVGQWLFGPHAGPTMDAVRKAVQTVTGSTEPQAQAAALADPGKASILRVELARIAAERAAAAGQSAQAGFSAGPAAATDARSMAGRPVQAEGVMAWGASLVSVLVLATFGGVVAMAFLRPMPAGAEPVLNVLLGTLGAMATSVVSYWVGSSAGSARKDARLATLVDR